MDDRAAPEPPGACGRDFEVYRHPRHKRGGAGKPTRAIAGRDESPFDLGLDELAAVTKDLAAFGVPEENFAVDLTIARGLDYYTGTVYETTLLDHPEIGSDLCSGGRYDNLAEYYTDRQLPGVEHFDRPDAAVLRPFRAADAERCVADGAGGRAGAAAIDRRPDPCHRACHRASRAGRRAPSCYTEAKKFKAKIQYADKLAIPYVIFLRRRRDCGGYALRQGSGAQASR